MRFLHVRPHSVYGILRNNSLQHAPTLAAQLIHFLLYLSVHKTSHLSVAQAIAYCYTRPTRECTLPFPGPSHAHHRHRSPRHLPAVLRLQRLALARYHGARIQRRAILVVHTDNGLEGLGENIGDAPDGDALRAKYIGTSPFDWINAEQDLAMNMACYDLMGKHLGIPAWKLIGPKVRSWIPVAAWTVAQAPDAMAEEVRQAAARGYHWDQVSRR